MGTYPIAVVGESFPNDDGSSRQAEIRRCRAGEPVTLERDPDNPHDSKCVKVLSARGVQIGNIGRDCAWIGERLDRGASVEARIGKVAKAGSRGKYGVVLHVTTDGVFGEIHDDEDEEEETLTPALSRKRARGSTRTPSGGAIVGGIVAALLKSLFKVGGKRRYRKRW